MKTKFYKVVELTGENTIETFDRSTFDDKEDAIQFIEDFNDPFYQLTILEVWE